MTMWDFFHAHADGLGAIVITVVLLLFLAWFVKELG